RCHAPPTGFPYTTLFRSQRRVREEQHPADAGQRPGQGGDDDERIEPRLEIHNDQQVGQNDRANKPESETLERIFHRLYLAANGEDRKSTRLNSSHVSTSY